MAQVTKNRTGRPRANPVTLPNFQGDRPTPERLAKSPFRVGAVRDAAGAWGKAVISEPTPTDFALACANEEFTDRQVDAAVRYTEDYEAVHGRSQGTRSCLDWDPRGTDDHGPVAAAKRKEALEAVERSMTVRELRVVRSIVPHGQPIGTDRSGTPRWGLLVAGLDAIATYYRIPLDGRR